MRSFVVGVDREQLCRRRGGRKERISDAFEENGRDERKRERKQTSSVSFPSS